MDWRRIYGLATLTTAVMLGTLVGPAPADDDSGEVALDLMVTDCLSQTMGDAWVEVQIYRPGSGIVDSDSGACTNGAISFRFADLECDDEARVTLTPSTSDSPDEGHVYICISGCGDAPSIWTITDQPQVCPDGWWNPSRIQAVYCTTN